MRESQIDWSTDALKTQLIGQWVKFTGWLLFDFEHTGQAENSSPGNPANWRATCWEVHPVSSFVVLAAQPEAAARTTAESLKTRQAQRAEKVKNNTALKNRMDERNRALSLLYKDEGKDVPERD